MPTSAESLTKQAVLLIGQGRFDEAIVQLQQALQMEPSNAEAHANLGNVFAYQKKHDEAIAMYRHAVRLKPDLFAAHYILGIALHEKTEFVEAENHFRHALRLNPQNAEVQHCLGVTLMAQRRVDEAVTCYHQALRLNPHSALFYMNLATALQEKDMSQEAISCYRHAVQLDPNFAEAHFNFGTALDQLDKLDEAIQHYQQALSLNPDYADAHHNLSFALRRQGRSQEAEIHERQVFRLKPKLFEVMANRSHATNLDEVHANPANAPSTITYNDIDGYFQFKAVYDLAVKECPEGVFVEVGAFLGRSTAYLASKIRDLPVKLYVVDTWQGSGGADTRGDVQYAPWLQKHQGDLFDAFFDNMERCGVLHFLTPLRMPSIQAAKLFPAGSIDFCFIDAAHDYASVKADLGAWFPKIRSGGIIAGDDYGVEWRGLDRAVNEFFADIGKVHKVPERAWLFRKP
jgi:tetratricopeptide (TPR) repeat protein